MIVSSSPSLHFLHLLHTLTCHLATFLQHTLQSVTDVRTFFLSHLLVASFAQIDLFSIYQRTHDLILWQNIPEPIWSKYHVLMRWSDVKFVDIGITTQVWSLKLSFSMKILIFFEIVVSNSSGGLKSSLKIEAVIGFLCNDIFINILPFFPDSLSLNSIVNWQSFVGFLSSHEIVAFREYKHSHRVSSISNINFVIVDNCSNATRPNTFYLLISKL